jgi:hypothetical protein
MVEEPEYGVVQVDISNAFNSISRDHMLHRVQEAAPELLPWTYYLYGQSSHLFCGSSVIPSSEGTQQGDPLGPALFCIALHPLISQLSNCGLAWQGWFMDDGVLVGTVSALASALETLQREAPKLHLAVNLDKCLFWSKLLPHGETCCGPLRRTPWAHSLPVLGIPFGGGHPDHYQMVLGRLAALLQRLLLLRDPQAALLILRACLGAQRITYLLRVQYSSHTATLSVQVADLLRTTLASLLQSDLTEAAWMQACLPLSLGGLGIQNPTLLRESAYISSSLSELVLSEHVSLPTPHVTQTFWTAARAYLNFFGHTFPEDNPLRSWLQTPQQDITSLLPPNLTQQDTWSRWVYKKALGTLQSSVPIRDCVRLERQSRPHAGAWLHAVPNQALDNKFGASDFRTLLRFHLGLPLISSNLVGSPCPLCNTSLDRFGDHILSCQKAGLWRRHHHACEAVQNIGVAARYGVLSEVPVQGRRRPADLLLTHWHNGQSLAVDITIVHALVPSTAWHRGLSYVDHAEGEKVAESEELCKQAGILFAPVGMDTFGSYGTQGADILSRMFKHYADAQGVDPNSSEGSLCISQCWERVSVAVHKSIAVQLSVLSDLNATCEAHQPLMQQKFTRLPESPEDLSPASQVPPSTSQVPPRGRSSRPRCPPGTLFNAEYGGSHGGMHPTSSLL